MFTLEPEKKIANYLQLILEKEKKIANLQKEVQNLKQKVSELDKDGTLQATAFDLLEKAAKAPNVSSGN